MTSGEASATRMTSGEASAVRQMPSGMVTAASKKKRGGVLITYYKVSGIKDGRSRTGWRT